MVSQSGSISYTIIRKCANLTVVQKTLIDTLQKESKHHKVIAKEAGCSHSAVSKAINDWLSRKKRYGRKRSRSKRDRHISIYPDKILVVH